MRKINILILLMTVMISAVGCGTDLSSLESSETESSATTTMTESFESSETESPETETENLSSEQKILEDFCIQFYGKLNAPAYVREGDELVKYENDAVVLMHEAEKIPDRILGSISDEEDVIQKARLIWLELKGAEYVEHIESDYIEKDGQKIHYERTCPPYDVKYYEEYDIWYIAPNAPMGVLDDGTRIATPSTPPYLLIRGEDGVILGAFI